MSLKNRRSFLAGAVLLCATAFPQVSRSEAVKGQPATAPQVFVRTELYFGTNMSNGEVSDEEFNHFVDVEVTRLFPDGLTHLVGQGQFRNSAGDLIREKSHVVILLYPPKMQDANDRIQAIRERYKTRFKQESVLRLDNYAFVSF
jgi:Protein of unknown function (DUF3574)